MAGLACKSRSKKYLEKQSGFPRFNTSNCYFCFLWNVGLQCYISCLHSNTAHKGNIIQTSSMNLAIAQDIVGETEGLTLLGNS